MARINIEDRLYKDNRWIELCIRLGSKWTALGALVDAWTLAQEQVTPENPKAHIPIAKWRERKACEHIITEGFAKVIQTECGEVVEIDGAKKQFAWLVTAQIKGRKGGLAKAAKASDDPEDPAPATKNVSPANQEGGSGKPLSSSLFSPSSSSELTPPAADSPPPAPPAPENASPGEIRGTVIPVLSGNSRLVQVLQFVPPDVQRSWVDRWTPRSITATIQNGIDHHLTETGAQSLAGVSDWGARITRWMRQEKVTLVERKDPPADKAKVPATGFQTGARQALGGITPMEAFRQRKAGVKGTA